MNNLVLRTISGIVLVIVLLGGILWCEVSRFIVLSAIAIGTLWEMLGLFSKSGVQLLSKGRYTLISGFILLFLNFFFYPLFWSFVILYFIIRFTAELYRKKKRPLVPIGYELFALGYTILPIALLNTVHENIIIMIFVLVWTNDVGAYLIGSQFGKRRLFPRISPKKSWEGLYGGVVLTIITSVALGHFWLDGMIAEAIILGIVISVASTYGDLFESMFKRSIDVKDSGNIIPGHGGFWDRFDALFFAIPTYFAIREIIPYIF